MGEAKARLQNAGGILGYEDKEHVQFRFGSKGTVEYTVKDQAYSLYRNGKKILHTAHLATLIRSLHTN